MTENPINPAALYDYAASKNDMDSLRPEERTFLEACAWEWERLIDHGAEEWGKQFEALGIKPGVPQAPSAKPTPAAPEKPAPSSPAAERAEHEGKWDAAKPEGQPSGSGCAAAPASDSVDFTTEWKTDTHAYSIESTGDNRLRLYRDGHLVIATRPGEQYEYLLRIVTLTCENALADLTADGLRTDIEQLREERDELIRWKREANESGAMLGKILGAKVLDGVGEGLLDAAKRMVVERDDAERRAREHRSALWDRDELIRSLTRARDDANLRHAKADAARIAKERADLEAERADEGLEEEAERLREAYTNDEGSWLEWPDCRQEPWLRVARAARALRRGGVTADLLREANDLYGKFDLASEHGSKLRLDLSERIEAHLAALDSGASVVVDREEWERTKADLERLRAFYRSVNDEIPEGLWPAATTLDAFRKLVDGYANVCADAKALHEREEERDRALADTEHRHALAERERDALAAKLEEAERALCERAEQVDKLMQERDLVMARLGNFCQPGEIEDRIRILQGHAGKMERQRDEARADAERLREANTKLLMGTAPPTVAVTNHALAASKIVAALLPRAGDLDAAMARGQTEAILRACTRAASVEEVRKAILHAFAHPSDPNDGDAMTAAKAALRALGVREAEKNTEGGAPIRKDGGCGESPATFSPPSVPSPAPAQAGWTDVAAESIVKMLRPHNGESRHRLNVEEVLDILRARAPKVRVRLPALRSYEANGESTAWKAGYNDARMECAAALRSAGVLIEGEQS